MRPGLVGPVIAIMVGALGGRAEGPISGVSVSPPFFNPTIGQKESIAFSVPGGGDVTVSLLDRDLVSIRALPVLKGAKGLVQVEWDGRDDGGRIVPDEAYTVRIVCECANGVETYAPAVGFKPKMAEPSRTYSMVSGVIRYELEGPSRVHIQAGQAALLADGKRAGPVLKTVVDREPRSGGAVAEQFDGFDASGTIFIPSLKDFAVSIMSESLPPTAVIAVGNREESFLQYASKRRAAAVIRSAPPEDHPRGSHHQGLNTLEDHTPSLTLNVPGPRDTDGRVRVGGKPFEVRVDMSTDEAKHFLQPDSILMVFVDERSVFQKSGMTPPAVVMVEPGALAPGEHRLAVNWVSPYGPVGVQATRMIVEPSPAAVGVKR